MALFHKKGIVTDPEKVEAVLSRGVTEAIVKDVLRAKLLSGKRLRIKFGVDPTSPDLHLGRAVPLLKLRDFQELGHQIVLIVGDFTALIGDTSDKDSERPMLSEEHVRTNKKTYVEQIGKLLDLKQTEVHYNTEWLEGLTYSAICEHADLFSVADFIARENIKRRLDAGKRVSLREVLYPLMQGYDSVAIRADVEVGGIDQKFNLLAGRTMQEKIGLPAQDIVMGPLLIGLDGRKMSSSWGNTIPLTAAAQDMYGKLMSIADAQVSTYFELCTRMPLEEIRQICTGHPKEAKMRLAYEITMLYHSKAAAEKAQQHFITAFSEGGIPEDIVTVSAPAGALLATLLQDHGLVASRSEFTRLVEQGAVQCVETGEKITDAHAVVSIESTYRIGKHRFIRFLIK